MTLHQMINTKIRLIVFLVVQYGKTLYSQQKQYLELTVAQIISSLSQNPSLDERKQVKLLGHSGMTCIKYLMIIPWR